jgi:hypothetical protein
MNMVCLKQIPPWWWVVAFFLLLNALTFDWYTTLYMDEVMFADPAANLYFGHGFTSTAWPTQHYGEFWAGNTPLYSCLLYVWFKCVGFGMFQVRFLDYLLWSGMVALFCIAVQRLRLIRRTYSLAILAALLFSGNGVFFSYRSGRYDSLMCLVAGLCFFAFSISNTFVRRSVIIISASLMLPTSLVLGPFAAILGLLVFLFLGRRFFLELCCVAFGLAIGLVFLRIMYGELGLWHAFRHAADFLSQIYYHRGSATPIWQQKIMAYPARIFHDSTADLLLVCLLGVIAIGWKKLDSTGRSAAILGVSVFFIIPAVSLAAYSYQIYHYWQVYLPLAVCLMTAVTHGNSLFIPSMQRVLVGAAVVVIFCLGPGIRLGMALTDLNERTYSHVESLVMENVKPSDVVYADYQAFYPLHQVGALTYYSWYLNVITKQEEDSITCLVIQPDMLPGLQKIFGGQWQAVGTAYLHENKFNSKFLNRLFPRYFEPQTNQKYNLAIYRRVPAAETPPWGALDHDFNVTRSNARQFKPTSALTEKSGDAF